jgi:transcriptional regulator with XRE-family HTH domain
MDEDWKQRFAATVKQLMAERGWSASELARQAGLGTDNISRYLSAKYVPGAKHLAKMAEAFGVQPAELYGSPADECTAELRVLRNDPTQAQLRINQVVPLDVALQILTLANNAKAQSFPDSGAAANG